MAFVPKRPLPASDRALKHHGLLHTQILDLLTEVPFSNSDEIADSFTATILCTLTRAFSRLLWSHTQSTRNSFDSIKRIQEDTVDRDLTNTIRSDELLIKEWRGFHDVLGRHQLAYSNFTRWFRSSETDMSTRGKAISELLGEELRDVVSDSCRLEMEMRERIQVYVAAMSLLESRRGIQQTSSVVRLTQLAFIFIPLTFTTGVFGMNVEILKNGAPMWQFWVTAATISVGALICIALITRVERKVQVWQHSAREEDMDVSVYLARLLMMKITGRFPN